MADHSVFEFSGGALCLDFANTLGDRPRANNECLRGMGDLIRWCAEAGTLTRAESRRYRERAERSADGAGRAFRRAVGLRERVYRVFGALARGRRADAADLEALNKDLASTLSRLRLVPGTKGFVWAWDDRDPGFDRLTWPVVRSAGELLTSDEAVSVRECGSEVCSWLFVDRSRTRRRRWCDMKTCGNRAKARRHYRKAKAANATGRK